MNLISWAVKGISDPTTIGSRMDAGDGRRFHRTGGYYMGLYRKYDDSCPITNLWLNNDSTILADIDFCANSNWIQNDIVGAGWKSRCFNGGLSPPAGGHKVRPCISHIRYYAGWSSYTQLFMTVCIIMKTNYEGSEEWTHKEAIYTIVYLRQRM